MGVKKLVKKSIEKSTCSILRDSNNVSVKMSIETLISVGFRVTSKVSNHQYVKKTVVEMLIKISNQR
jgi:hypothetical protein